MLCFLNYVRAELGFSSVYPVFGKQSDQDKNGSSVHFITLQRGNQKNQLQNCCRKFLQIWPEKCRSPLVECALSERAASGLPAIKWTVQYGAQPVCYEMSHDMGGLWRYKDYDCEGECWFGNFENLKNNCKIEFLKLFSHRHEKHGDQHVQRNDSIFGFYTAKRICKFYAQHKTATVLSTVRQTFRFGKAYSVRYESCECKEIVWLWQIGQMGCYR